MKWFKHDSDANMDGKLQEILLDYGLEGYGLYWYCLEMIVNKIDYDNLTFELEHDARIVARNTGCTVKKVTEMMKKFVELGLFENSQGRITCMKLLTRLDKSMTSNPKFRDAIAKAKQSHDPVMIKSDLVMQEEKRLEEKRERIEDNTQQAAITHESFRDLFNNIKNNTNANWCKLMIVNDERKARIKKLITFAKQRIKETPLKKDEKPETPAEYLQRLFTLMGKNEFYSGRKPSAAYPSGYKWNFIDITADKHIIKFIEDNA